MKIVFAVVSIGLLIFFHTILLLDIGRRLILALNSDSLYLASVYQDVFVNGYSITGWIFSPSPCFFPDLFFLTIFEILSPSVGIGLVFYNVAYFFAMALGLYGVIRFWKVPALESSVTILFILLILAILLQSRTGLPFASVLLGPGRHAGSMLIGLFLLRIAFQWLNRGMSCFDTGLFFVLSILTVFSDVSFIPQFLAPLCTVLMIYAYRGWTSWRVFFSATILSVLAAIGGHFLLVFFVAIDWLIVPKPNLTGLGNWTVILTSVRQFFADTGRFFNTNPGFPFLVIIGTVLSIVFLLVYRRDFRKESFTVEFISNPRFFLHFWFLFSLISLLATLALPILTGLWMSSAEIRYIQPVLIYPFWTIVFLCAAYRREIPRSITYTLSIALLSIILTIVIPLKSFRWNDFQYPYPEKAQFIDRVTRQYHLQYGYGDYWNAKFLTQFSRNAIQVNQLAPNLMPYFWINNRQWYWKTVPNDSSNYPDHQFVITDRLQRDSIEKRFGKPAYIERSADMEVYIYNRPEDRAFRNFLRHFFIKEIDSTKISRPLDPRPLQRYKSEGIPQNDSDTIPILPNQELIVQFPQETHGDILEISAASDGEYDVTFLHPWMGSNFIPVSTILHVPAGTGEGLSIRYLKIPEEAAAEPIPMLKIVLTNGDPQSKIGHLFIYTDPLVQED